MLRGRHVSYREGIALSSHTILSLLATLFRVADVHHGLGVKVNVVENTAAEITFVIPVPLSDVSVEDLAGVAGGVFNQNYFVINAC